MGMECWIGDRRLLSHHRGQRGFAQKKTFLTKNKKKTAKTIVRISFQVHNTYIYIGHGLVHRAKHLRFSFQKTVFGYGVRIPEQGASGKSKY